MAKPAIVAVDDDPEVLRAVARDLRDHFAKDYRILPAASGGEALDVIRTLKLRNEPLALFLADQRMPEMTGIEFLAEAAPLFPTAKRVLLTAYADRDVAIRAINEVRLDYYLMKPWEPPEQLLYPALDDLLQDWKPAIARPSKGSRWSTTAGPSAASRSATSWRATTCPIAGSTWSATRRRRDIDSARSRATATRCRWSSCPTAAVSHARIEALADCCGGPGRPTPPFTISSWWAAARPDLPPAVYGASEGLRTLIVESEAPGGQAGTSSRIENYLGFPNGPAAPTCRAAR